MGCLEEEDGVWFSFDFDLDFCAEWRMNWFNREWEEWVDGLGDGGRAAVAHGCRAAAAAMVVDKAGN